MGDRYEMLLGPLAAIPFNIPTVHFFGGAVTEGAIDEMIRHGLTKMSHIHFVLLNIYKKRLLNLGEENWRIKVIGMPSLNRKKIFTLLDNSIVSFMFGPFFVPSLLISV